MSLDRKEWLSLTKASSMLGVHPTTLRRWADSDSIPCLRTPGGHRRFRTADLVAWMQGPQSTAPAPRSEALVQSAVGYTRQEMALQRVSGELWYAAFEREEERQQMRDTGRQLFGLAIQYMGRTRDHEPVLQEGRRIGEFFGQQCATRGVSLVDTVRAQFFFRESLLRVIRPDQGSQARYDAEDVRLHRQLRHFLDEVMVACLGSYEVTCRHLVAAEAAL